MMFIKTQLLVVVIASVAVSYAVYYASHRDPAYYGPSDVPAFGFAERVEYATGGSVSATKIILSVAQFVGQKTVIDGACISACTIAVTFSHVCWTKKARFRFHGATLGGKDSESGTRDFLAEFPPSVRERLPVAAYLRSKDWVEVNGEEMAQLTGRPLCGSE